ncbi:unnamed protein product [Paramecium octaurelia]|uniref:Uncharacterized protein n=1 Tax=Paramecium octaurelia TaxID=43137 RepID=A0A8S1VJ91_PAROT|nr:unnamed protein product [Paramecium octaurelia]
MNQGSYGYYLGSIQTAVRMIQYNQNDNNIIIYQYTEINQLQASHVAEVSIKRNQKSSCFFGSKLELKQPPYVIKWDLEKLG